MAIKLNVPLVPQQASMECWYASACMVAYFRRPGPRLGLPEKWVANRGIGLADFVRLAQAEGLKSVLTPAGDLTPQHLEVLLRNNGPIWCAGRWDGVPHIVVLTGIDGQTVYINDPNPAKGARVETLAWFNQKLDRIPNCLMYMPA
jgi:ABC-type bacteriocin/lantibiotic exporter with double-glycine peptidase domain